MQLFTFSINAHAHNITTQNFYQDSLWRVLIWGHENYKSFNTGPKIFLTKRRVSQYQTDETKKPATLITVTKDGNTVNFNEESNEYYNT